MSDDPADSWTVRLYGDDSEPVDPRNAVLVRVYFSPGNLLRPLTDGERESIAVTAANAIADFTTSPDGGDITLTFTPPGTHADAEADPYAAYSDEAIDTVATIADALADADTPGPLTTPHTAANPSTDPTTNADTDPDTDTGSYTDAYADTNPDT